MSAYENYKPAPIDLVLEDSRLFRMHTVTDNVIFHSRQEAEDFSDLIKQWKLPFHLANTEREDDAE